MEVSLIQQEEECSTVDHIYYSIVAEAHQYLAQCETHIPLAGKSMCQGKVCCMYVADF